MYFEKIVTFFWISSAMKKFSVWKLKIIGNRYPLSGPEIFEKSSWGFFGDSGFFGGLYNFKENFINEKFKNIALNIKSKICKNLVIKFYKGLWNFIWGLNFKVILTVYMLRPVTVFDVRVKKQSIGTRPNKSVAVRALNKFLTIWRMLVHTISLIKAYY